MNVICLNMEIDQKWVLQLQVMQLVKKLVTKDTWNPGLCKDTKYMKKNILMNLYKMCRKELYMLD